MFDDLALLSTVDESQKPDGVRALKLFVRRDQPSIGMTVYETNSGKLLRYDTLEPFKPGRDWQLKHTQCPATPGRDEMKESS